MFWKEAWLKPVLGDANALPDAPAEVGQSAALGYLLRTRRDGRYFCQSTQLHAATRPLSPWNVAHFIPEFLNGELSLARFVEAQRHAHQRALDRDERTRADLELERRRPGFGGCGHAARSSTRFDQSCSA